jgi:hypothetical protein
MAMAAANRVHAIKSAEPVSARACRRFDFNKRSRRNVIDIRSLLFLEFMGKPEC